MRLIDAYELKIELQDCMFNDNMMNPLMRYTDILEIIDKQQTAYDIDKVVEELERFATDPCETEKYCKHAYDGFLENKGCEHCVAERAIEIVKVGGKE